MSKRKPIVETVATDSLLDGYYRVYDDGTAEWYDIAGTGDRRADCIDVGMVAEDDTPEDVAAKVRAAIENDNQ